MCQESRECLVCAQERERVERGERVEKILEADGRCITLLLLERVARTLSCEFKLLGQNALLCLLGRSVLWSHYGRGKCNVRLRCLLMTLLVCVNSWLMLHMLTLHHTLFLHRLRLYHTLAFPFSHQPAYCQT